MLLLVFHHFHLIPCWRGSWYLYQCPALRMIDLAMFQRLVPRRWSRLGMRVGVFLWVFLRCALFPFHPIKQYPTTLPIVVTFLAFIGILIRPPLNGNIVLPFPIRSMLWQPHIGRMSFLPAAFCSLLLLPLICALVIFLGVFLWSLRVRVSVLWISFSLFCVHVVPYPCYSMAAILYVYRLYLECLSIIPVCIFTDRLFYYGVFFVSFDILSASRGRRSGVWNRWSPVYVLWDTLLPLPIPVLWVGSESSRSGTGFYCSVWLFLSVGRLIFYRLGPVVGFLASPPPPHSSSRMTHTGPVGWVFFFLSGYIWSIVFSSCALQGSSLVRCFLFPAALLPPSRGLGTISSDFQGGSGFPGCHISAWLLSLLVSASCSSLRCCSRVSLPGVGAAGSASCLRASICFPVLFLLRSCIPHWL